MTPSPRSPVPQTAPDTMRAIVLTRYGAPDALQLQTVPKPQPSAHQLLVRVRAAAVNAGDRYLMRGKPFLTRFIYGGLRQPKIRILGFDMAGEVEAVGSAVTQFQPGDAVFGDLSVCGFGAFAEYVCVSETAVVKKPANIDFETAAAVPGAALTALQGLRDLGRIQPGQRVLVLGSSGGVGSFAVQLAKRFGATVTAVCRPDKVEMVRSLGADRVVDSTQTDVTQIGERYDLIFDAAAYRSVFDYVPLLTESGTYVLVGGNIPRLFFVLIFGSILSKLTRRSLCCLSVQPNPTDLLTLQGLLASGQLVPYRDRTYDLSDLPAAIRHLEDRHVKGKLVIRVAA